MQQRLWEISALTSTEAEEAVAELLQRLTATPATSYHDLRTNHVRVAAHVAEPPPAPRELRRTILRALDEIKAFGLNTAPAQVRIRRLAAVDWAESWKDHFPTLEIAKTLLIKPHWDHRRPGPGQIVIELDPGLSFGTGHHPTTRFCLEELIRARPRAEPHSMLDIGTGSGLLAIAAAKLGYRPVLAFDFDPVAVKVARHNARTNGVGRQIRVSQADLRHLGQPLRPSTVVCANLQADLLTEQAHLIAQAVQPGGTLILAGILRSEMDPIRATYLSLGWHCVRVRSRAEWSSASFRGATPARR